MPAQRVPLHPLLPVAGKKREREESDGYLPEELDAWEAFVGSGKGQARLCRCVWGPSKQGLQGREHCVWGPSKQGLQGREHLAVALMMAGQVLS